MYTAEDLHKEIHRLYKSERFVYVHGGESYYETVVVTDEELRDLEDDYQPYFELPGQSDPGLTPYGLLQEEEHFGGEGQGDNYYIVLSVTHEDGSKRYFRVDGWHQSHVGSELDTGPYEVTPKQVSVTQYSKK